MFNLLISGLQANAEQGQLFFHSVVTSAPKCKACNDFIRLPILVACKLNLEITYIAPVAKKLTLRFRCHLELYQNISGIGLR